MRGWLVLSRASISPLRDKKPLPGLALGWPRSRILSLTGKNLRPNPPDEPFRPENPSSHRYDSRLRRSGHFSGGHSPCGAQDRCHYARRRNDALVDLGRIDCRRLPWRKKRGTRSEPIRALPPYDTFRNHEGIRIKQLRALKLEDGFWVHDVRTSKYFVNELTRAYESQSFTWTRIDGSIATIVWRFFERGGVPFKDRGQMCKYLTVSERELDSDRITTLDASITGPALKWIIETVGLGYLGERGDEASRAFSWFTRSQCVRSFQYWHYHPQYPTSNVAYIQQSTISTIP